MYITQNKQSHTEKERREKEEERLEFPQIPKPPLTPSPSTRPRSSSYLLIVASWQHHPSLQSTVPTLFYPPWHHKLLPYHPQCRVMIILLLCSKPWYQRCACRTQSRTITTPTTAAPSAHGLPQSDAFDCQQQTWPLTRSFFAAIHWLVLSFLRPTTTFVYNTNTCELYY